MKRILYLIACITGLGFAQGLPEVDFTRMVSIGTNAESWPSFLQIDLPEISTSVTLITPPYIATCPAMIYRDFDLEKVNPDPGHFLIEKKTCANVAGLRDTTIYNLNFVYKFYGWDQRPYYLQVHSASELKMQIEVTSRLPSEFDHVMGVNHTARGAFPIIGGQGFGSVYLPNGKAVTLGANHRAMVPAVHK